MDHHEIAIVTLPPERWQEYRDLRLTALRTDPIAFGETLERADAYPDSTWRERLEGTSNWLVFAGRDGRLIGLAGAFLPPEQPGIAHIVSVYVDAAFRGQGIGRRMLTALVEDISASGDASVIRLHVNDTNAPAIALYASLGFAVVGTERDALQHDGVSYDELIMERRL